jgi:hypothetical protein
MGMSGISKSQVNRLCGDEKAATFLNRPLEGDWPYVWLDATYVKARRDGRIASVAVIIAVGVNGDGRREVLGMATGATLADRPLGDLHGIVARRTSLCGSEAAARSVGGRQPSSLLGSTRSRPLSDALHASWSHNSARSSSAMSGFSG